MTCTRTIGVPVILALVVLAVCPPVPAQTTQPAAESGSPTGGQATQPAAADEPLSVEQLSQAGADALAAGDAVAAVKAFSALVQAQPNNTSALLGLADAYLRARNVLQAVEMYNRCRKISPNDWRADFGLGTIYLQQDYFRLAKPFLERAIMLAPPQAQARGRVAYNLALTYRGLHDLPGAIEQARKTLSFDATNIDARRLLVALHSEADRLDDASAEARATVEALQDKLAKAPENRSSAQQMVAVLSMWADILQKQIAAKPNDPSPCLQLADVLEQLATAGQMLTLLDAIQQVNAVLEKAPDNPDIRFAHARLEYLMAQPAKAAEELRAILKATPTHARSKQLLEKIESTASRPAEG